MAEWHQFARLPGELANIIWEHVLHQERILHIQLKAAPSLDDTDTCEIILIERRIISKVFRVNSRSRGVAMGFYRVHLPCTYRWDNHIGRGTFYFHPELDTLEVRDPENCHLSPCFAKFAHNLWENDWKHVGLVNLMVGAYRITPILVNPGLLLQHALKRLRRVIFVPEFERPWWIQFSDSSDHERQQSTPNYKRWFLPGERTCLYRHRSAIRPVPPNFVRRVPESRQDFVRNNLPRDINMNALGQRELLMVWFFQLAAVGIAHDHKKVEYRLMLPFGPTSVAELEHYAAHYHYPIDRGGRVIRAEYQGPRRYGFTDRWDLTPRTPSELAALRPPGFWLIPIEHAIEGHSAALQAVLAQRSIHAQLSTLRLDTDDSDLIEQRRTEQRRLRDKFYAHSLPPALPIPTPDAPDFAASQPELCLYTYGLQ